MGWDIDLKHKEFNCTIKEHSGISIKWSIFLYLIIFISIIVVILWLCQVVFFEDIYKSTRTHEVTAGASRISNAIKKKDGASIVDEVSKKYNYCITVYQLNKIGNISPIYVNHRENGCVIHSIDRSTVKELYDYAENNGGSRILKYKFDSEKRKYYGLNVSIYGENEIPESSKGLREGIIYSGITTDYNGYYSLILIDAIISPVQSTVNTLRTMLYVITAFVVIMALLLAILISVRVSTPIQKLTQSAERLAKGDYDTHFPGTGYREAKKLSDTLNFAQKELSRVDEVRKELIANVSHDLRTPLTMISGYAEVIRDIPDENTPENIQIIIDEASRLKELVNDVLDISQIDSELGANKMIPFALNETVREVLERFTKLCQRDGYRIEFICDGEVNVVADRHRIVQALYNLVGNAINHVGDDMLVRVTQQTYNNWVRISVSDNGEGIPADKLPLIWDRYYKIDKVHKRSVVGTGLGLSIVKKVMDLNGGRCGVYSKEGVGTTFYIELPVKLIL